MLFEITLPFTLYTWGQAVNLDLLYYFLSQRIMLYGDCQHLFDTTLGS